MNQETKTIPQQETRILETLSITTSESHSNNSSSNEGFRYLCRGQRSLESVPRIPTVQALEEIRPQITVPCTPESIQELFRVESSHMYMEELYHHMPNKTPFRDLMVNIENAIRQQFVQRIPDLLKSMRNTTNQNGNPNIEFVLPRVETSERKQDKQELVGLELLAPLSIFLSKLLKGETISESETDLSWIEKVILASIINKKYKHKSIKKIEKITDMTPEFLQQFPQSISQGISLKRTEENYKIVFNWCFKFLKKRLADQIAFDKKKPLCKRELEEYFYNFYFKQVADERGTSITKFYKPNFTNKLQNVEKTFNTHFISHIQLSHIFMRDFNHALGLFVPTHLDLIDKKLRSLFLKWEEMLNLESNTEETLRNISNYIMKSSKCKLPWSKKEIEVAHRTVANLFK